MASSTSTGWSLELGGRGSRHPQVDRWWAAREQGDDAVLYAYARDAVRVLNGLARRHAEDAGRLTGPALEVGECVRADLAPRSYRVGDELCCLRNKARIGVARDASGKGVRNGTRGVIEAIDQTTGEVTLATRDGRVVRLPASYVAQATDYGYAWTLHKGQGQTVGQPTWAGEDETRRKGSAFVFGAEGLSAEAALVAASRATDTTELYVLVDPEEVPDRPDEGDEALGRAWSRSEQQRLALDELATEKTIAQLAASPRALIGAERDALVSLIGTGPAIDLSTRRIDAIRRLGAALVERDEAADTAGALSAMSAASEGIERRNIQGRLTGARRRLTRAEQEAAEAGQRSEAADAALKAQQEVRAVSGSDVRSALDRLEIVDSALASVRRNEVESWSSSPPEHVVALLGPRPTQPGKAQRWQQGEVEIEDLRREMGVVDSEVENPWTRALGPPGDGFEGRRRRRVVTTLAGVRRDLGIVEVEAVHVVNGSPPCDEAIAAVLARCSPDNPQPPASPAPDPTERTLGR